MRVNDLVSSLFNERNVPRDLCQLWPLLTSPTSAKLSKQILVVFNIDDTVYLVGLLIYYFINVKILDFVCVFLS